MEATIKPPQPQASSQTQPQPPVDPIQAVVERARNGDASALPELEKFLDANPKFWQQANDLVALNEQAWIEKICGKDMVLGQSIRRQLQALKQEVAGPSPSPLERLLAERIGASWLAVQHSELSETCGEGAGVKVAQLKLKRLESANRRFLAAVKSLAVVRRLTNGLRVEINHVHQPATAPAASAATPATTDVARDRIRDLFGTGAAIEKQASSMVGT